MTWGRTGGRIPMYDQVTPELISVGISPLSFLGFVTKDDLYSISMSYVKGALFGQTAQGLVQGMASFYTVHKRQQLFIYSTFGASHPALLYTVLVVSVGCALSVTLANTITRSVRQTAPTDPMRIMAISRNPQMDTVFGPYSDRKVKMDEEMLNARVGYTWIDSLQRHALVFSHIPSAVDGPFYQSTHTNMGTESTLNTSTSPSNMVVGSENDTDVDQVKNVQLQLLNGKY